jgi:hypothetical protein
VLQGRRGDPDCALIVGAVDGGSADQFGLSAHALDDEPLGKRTPGSAAGGRYRQVSVGTSAAVRSTCHTGAGLRESKPERPHRRSGETDGESQAFVGQEDKSLWRHLFPRGHANGPLGDAERVGEQIGP